MDWWDALPFTVSQLPFHDMTQVSVSVDSEKFPDDATAIDYQLNYNDRFDSGEPVRSYRFDYKLMPSTPADDTNCGPASPACPSTSAQVRSMTDLVLQPAVASVARCCGPARSPSPNSPKRTSARSSD